MFFNLRRFFPQNCRRMNKFVLHCNKCTIVTRFFNLDFVGRYPWKKFAKQIFFVCEQANLSPSDRFRKNFPTVQNGPEKRKNYYLIKLVSKSKREIRKKHTSFLVFHFWDLKFMPNESALNSASDN